MTCNMTELKVSWTSCQEAQLADETLYKRLFDVNFFKECKYIFYSGMQFTMLSSLEKGHRQ